MKTEVVVRETEHERWFFVHEWETQTANQAIGTGAVVGPLDGFPWGYLFGPSEVDRAFHVADCAWQSARIGFGAL